MTHATIDLPSPHLSEIHPLLRTSRDTRRMIFVRLLAYVSGLAVLTALLADLFGGSPAAAVAPAAVAPEQQVWIAASRSYPAFAVSHLDSGGISDAYRIYRHPEGGRRDIMRWAVPPGPDATVEIEVYRPGEEAVTSQTAGADIASRIGLPEDTHSETAGIIASKLGPVSLIRFSGTAAAAACLGFIASFEDPVLRLSGWSCQKQPIPEQRTFLACALDRLVLLSAGNDPRLAALFARAELRRTGCMTQTLASDWISQTQEPVLRGRL